MDNRYPEARAGRSAVPVLMVSQSHMMCTPVRTPCVPPRVPPRVPQGYTSSLHSLIRKVYPGTYLRTPAMCTLTVPVRHMGMGEK